MNSTSIPSILPAAAVNAVYKDLLNRYRIYDATQYPGSDIGAKINYILGLVGEAGNIRIIIPPGFYEFSTQIHIGASNITLEGSGPVVGMAMSDYPFGATLSWTGDPEVSPILCQGKYATNPLRGITLRNFVIRAPSDFGRFTPLIKLEGCIYYLIEYLQIIGPTSPSNIFPYQRGIGILVNRYYDNATGKTYGSHGGIIKNVQADYLSTGLQFYASAHGSDVENCSFVRNNRGIVIGPDTSTLIRIRSSDIEMNAIAGIEIASGHAIVIEDCYFETYADSLDYPDSTSVRIGTRKYASNIVITNNTRFQFGGAYDSKLWPVHVLCCYSLNVTDCIFESYSKGVRITAPKNENFVLDSAYTEGTSNIIKFKNNPTFNSSVIGKYIWLNTEPIKIGAEIYGKQISTITDLEDGGKAIKVQNNFNIPEDAAVTYAIEDDDSYYLSNIAFARVKNRTLEKNIVDKKVGVTSIIGDNLKPQFYFALPTTSAIFQIVNLPTSDPHEVGALWNDNGTMKISNG